MSLLEERYKEAKEEYSSSKRHVDECEINLTKAKASRMMGTQKKPRKVDKQSTTSSSKPKKAYKNFQVNFKVKVSTVDWLSSTKLQLKMRLTLMILLMKSTLFNSICSFAYGLMGCKVETKSIFADM
eukprot:9060982-Ditylum_brightwellii.AAC.1